MSADNKKLLQIQKQIEAAPPQALGGEIQKLQQASKKDKKNPHIPFAAGMMLCKLGDFQSGSQLLKQSLKLAKSNSIILSALAYAHMTGLRDYEAALKYLKQRLSTDKDDTNTLLMMAHCNLEIGEPQNAIKLLNQAEPLIKDKLRIHGMRSNCYLRLGDSTSARKEYEAIKELHPDGIIAIGDMMAALPDNTPEQIQELQSELSQAITNSPEKFRDDMHRCMTFAALGNIEEKLGNNQVAFDYFNKANKIQPLDANAHSFKDTQEFEVQKAVFTKTFFDTHSHKGHQSKEQIFVLGMPRSGTTLIESILAGHSKIRDFDELEFFNQQIHHIGLTNFQKNGLEERIDIVRSNLASAPADGFVNIGKQYIEMHGFDKLKGIHKVDKMPTNFRALGFIALVFPNAKIIHAKRHPVDTCLSAFKNPLRGYNRTFANDLQILGQFYLEYANLMRHWQDVLPLNIHEVRYEDMVNDTEHHARHIISYLNLEWEDSCLSKRQTKRDVKTASMWQVRQDIYKTSVDKWRIYENELKPLTDILTPEIELYNNAS